MPERTIVERVPRLWRCAVLRDGRALVEKAELRTEEEIRRIPVVLPGAPQTGYKETSTRLPTSIRFYSRPVTDFAQEINKLLSAVGNVDAARAHRDEGWAVKPVELQVDGLVRPTTGWHIARPFRRTFSADLYEVEFPIDCADAPDELWGAPLF